MNPLPFKPLVAKLFGLFPGSVQAHRNPRLFFKNGSFDDERMLNRKKTSAPKIVAFQNGIVGKKKANVRMAIRCPGLGRNARIDLARDQQVVEFLSLRRHLQFEPGRRSPVADALGPLGNPMDAFEIDTELLCKDPFCPKGRGGKPGLNADTPPVKISGPVNPSALVNINIRMAEHALDKYGDGGQS